MRVGNHLRILCLVFVIESPPGHDSVRAGAPLVPRRPPLLAGGQPPLHGLGGVADVGAVLAVEDACPAAGGKAAVLASHLRHLLHAAVPVAFALQGR